MNRILLTIFLVPALAFGAGWAVLGLRWNSAPKNAGQLVPEPEMLDLGKFSFSELPDVQGRFHIRNRGDAERRIKRITSSCGCLTVLRSDNDSTNGETEAEDAEEIIRPGESRVVEFRLQPLPRLGEQVQIVTVRSDDPAQPNLPLRVRLEVTAALIGVPEKVLLGEHPGGTKLVREIHIIDLAGSSDTRLDRAQVSRPELMQVDLKEPPPKVPGVSEEYRRVALLLLHARFPPEPGEFAEKITLLLGDDARPALTIPILGRTTSIVQLSPSRLVFAGKPTQHVESTVWCLARGAQQLDVAVSAAAQGWQPEVAQGSASCEKRLTLRGTLSSQSGLSRQQLTLVCTVDGKTLDVQLPITTYVQPD